VEWDCNTETSRIGGGEIGGFGVLAIRERIGHMGGRLEIDGFPRQGEPLHSCGFYCGPDPPPSDLTSKLALRISQFINTAIQSSKGLYLLFRCLVYVQHNFTDFL
jgi:hypothetical protein